MSADASQPARSPGYDALPWVVRRWWLWAALALVAGALTVAAAGGFNIVDLELAGTLDRADEAVAGEDPNTIRSAIYWDFVFILFYVLALSTGALWARRLFGGGFASRMGIAVGAGAVLAGALDVVENLSMLGYLNEWGDWTGWVPLARATAILKFLFVTIAIIYVLIGIGLWAVRSLADRSTGT